MKPKILTGFVQVCHHKTASNLKSRTVVVHLIKIILFKFCLDPGVSSLKKDKRLQGFLEYVELKKKKERKWKVEVEKSLIY